jgi:hypothetical protein
MSNQYEDDYEEDEQEELDGTDLVKKLRKAERLKEKRIKELEGELSEIRSARRSDVINSVLSERGVNTKIAKFIPSDVESTPDALNSWLEENADVFGIQLASPQEQSEDQQRQLRTLRQIDAITANASVPVGVNEMFNRIDQAQSAEEILNMIYSAEQS